MNPKDLKDLERRAEEGDASAQTELGKMYYEGNGVPRHYEKARNLYFLDAAKQGDPEAQFYLGMMYYEGKGGQKDHKMAMYWLSKAVDAVSADAQLYLGEIREGESGPKSQLDAYQWFSLAAAQGNEEARAKLDALEKGMLPEEVSKAQNYAITWHWEHR